MIGFSIIFFAPAEVYNRIAFQYYDFVNRRMNGEFLAQISKYEKTPKTDDGGK